MILMHNTAAMPCFIFVMINDKKIVNILFVYVILKLLAMWLKHYML